MPSDKQRKLIEPLIVMPTGCPWRMLPHDFPPEGTVRDYFHKFKQNKFSLTVLFAPLGAICW